MKNKLFRSLFCLAFFMGAGVLITACQKKTGDFGQVISKDPVVPIADILLSPQDYEGKLVKVSGKITEECPYGGWFWLQGNNDDRIYVNLHPAQFEIPQAVGQESIAEGTVYVQSGRIEVVGTGVKLQ